MLDRLAVAPIVLLLLTTSWAGAPPQELGETAKLVRILTPQGHAILAELADTVEKRARGLMFRPSLEPDRGMLFAFSQAEAWTFWMKNTRIPLDIIWLDGQKRIVHIEANVPGCSRQDDGCPQYQPNHPALYVLEVAAGQAQALRLERGVKLSFDVGNATPEASPGSRPSGRSPGWP